MNGPREHWCDAFLDALYGDQASAALAPLVAQPGFAVYRNTVLKGCVDALAANFPAVARLTGPDWFRSAAASYARRHPPRSPSLLAYGDGFPRFLAAAASRHELPYLAPVACLEQMWLASHTGADEPVLAPAALAAVDGAPLGACRLVPHACARWHWWPDAPIASLWEANRDDTGAAAPPVWRGEGVLLTRPEGAVQWQAIGPGAAALLDACAAGSPLAEAAARAVAAAPGLDLAQTLADLLLAGAFSSCDCSEEFS